MSPLNSAITPTLLTREMMRTRTGELTLAVKAFTFLAKSLRPLPEKWHGLTDTETRFRQRYVDLIANDEARRVFEIRFAAITAIRRFLASSGSFWRSASIVTTYSPRA